ncbi:MAG: hypothetical protein AAGD07_09720 [Planctomycetota bacterium]
MAPTVRAQSGTRVVPQPSYRPAPNYSAPPTYSTPMGSQTRPMATQGSQTRVPAVGSQTKTVATPTALQGYCPVCVIEMKKWVKGSPQFAASYDGKRYLFPGEEQKQMFLKDPAKYVPAMGGNCTVCAVNMGQTVAGSVMFPALYENRLYLFPGEQQKQEFRSNPTKYANADVAYGGKCAVCRAEMNQVVDGKPEFTAFYSGKRYWFPEEKQRAMFLGNPAKYAEP